MIGTNKGINKGTSKDRERAANGVGRGPSKNNGSENKLSNFRNKTMTPHGCDTSRASKIKHEN